MYRISQKRFFSFSYDDVKQKPPPQPARGIRGRLSIVGFGEAPNRQQRAVAPSPIAKDGSRAKQVPTLRIFSQAEYADLFPAKLPQRTIDLTRYEVVCDDADYENERLALRCVAPTSGAGDKYMPSEWGSTPSWWISAPDANSFRQLHNLLKVVTEAAKAERDEAAWSQKNQKVARARQAALAASYGSDYTSWSRAGSEVEEGSQNDDDDDDDDDDLAPAGAFARLGFSPSPAPSLDNLGSPDLEAGHGGRAAAAAASSPWASPGPSPARTQPRSCRFGPVIMHDR